MSIEEGAAEAVEEVINDEIQDEESSEEYVEEGEEGYDDGEEIEVEAETTEELAEEIEEAIEDGATEEDVKEMIETFKFKANGKDKEVTLDWNNKEDIIRRLQLAESAQPAMQKSAELEKTFSEALEELKKDPWSVLKEIGHNPDELAEAYIQNKIDEMKKSPEELERDSMEKELADLRSKMKEEEESKKEIEYQRLQKEAEVELETQIMGAIDATTTLPKSPYVVKRIADSMLFAMDNGYPNVTAEQVLPSVEKEIKREYQEMVKMVPTEALEDLIGKQASERMRKNRLDRHKKAPKSKIKAVTKEKSKAKPQKKMSVKDFLGTKLS